MFSMSDFRARMRALTQRINRQVRAATAHIPAGESGVWINGKKVSSTAGQGVVTQITTVGGRTVVHQAVSLADAMASLSGQGGVTSMVRINTHAVSGQSLLARGQ